jgi:integrase
MTTLRSDEPGPPEVWAHVIRLQREARDAGKLEQWVGGAVNDLLLRQRVHTDAFSRCRLIEAVDAAVTKAARRLKRHSEGDYSPDLAAGMFPEWVPRGTSDAASNAKPISVDGLFERWATYQADKLAPNTVKRYGASLRSLGAFLKGREAQSVTGDELYRWAEHRRDNEGISSRAINKNDLVAVSSVFSWGADRKGGRLVKANPAKGVHLDEPRAIAQRARTFTPGEVSAILQAALSVKADPKNPTFSAAKRWCPWLAAYSGARISELTYLVGMDVREEAGIAFMHFRKTKTGQPRSVPIHTHLIEQGFLQFVASMRSSPLFYDPRRHKPGAKTNAPELRAHKVADWVRKAVELDMGVDPNHGWRHTWKTIALSVGIEERTRDAIAGHTVVSAARRYESPSLAMLAEAMRRFPRYSTDA